MEIIEPRRLYQQLAAELKTRIEQGVYLVGDKLPAEHFIADEKTSAAPWFVKPLSCWKWKGMSKSAKGRVSTLSPTIRNTSRWPMKALSSPTMAFELLQARQLIESNIAEFAATQVTKQDIMKLMEIQEKARNEKCFRDSEWDLQFHVRWRWRRRTARWRRSWKRCGPSACITPTGKAA